MSERRKMYVILLSSGRVRVLLWFTAIIMSYMPGLSSEYTDVRPVLTTTEEASIQLIQLQPIQQLV